jgi:hypothetical protein
MSPVDPIAGSVAMTDLAGNNSSIGCGHARSPDPRLLPVG